MYFASPRWGILLPAFLMAAFALPCSAQNYADLVLADGPFAYWRLDETAEGAATNLGTSEVESATYVGGDLLEFGVPGLADPDNSAVRFKGLDVDQFDEDGTISGGRINIADSQLTNLGGPVTEKTVELWFSADNADTEDAQQIYEQGGSTRGISMYVQNGEVVLGIHNSGADDAGVSTPWSGGTGAERALALVKADIESNTPYHVALVYDGDDDGFEGTVSGYLDGDLIGTVDGIGSLFAHSDDIALGGVRAQSLFEDGLLGTEDPSLHYFEGIIDEVAIYDYALSGGRIGVHFGDEVGADVNGDGNVDTADFQIIAANFNQPGALADGDLNFDGQVNMADFVTWRLQAQPQQAAGVPEPAAGILVLLGVSILSILRRRRA